VSLRVRSLSMFVRGLAVLAGRRCVVLRFFVLAARVMMLSLMVVMRCSVVVTSGGVMMLARRMFCHFSVLPCSDLGRTIVNRPTFLERTEELALRLAQFSRLGNGSGTAAERVGSRMMRIAVFSRQPAA
jgi:hypothetical protein